MVIGQSEIKLDMVREHKLSDLAYREGVAGPEMLRLLIDRAYAADLQVQMTEKPLIPSFPGEGGGGG